MTVLIQREVLSFVHCTSNWYCRERTEFCALWQLCARIRFRWKDLKKALHLIPFEGESKHTLSRLAAQRICERKILQVTLQIRWVRDTLKCEPGKKEVWTPNVVLISELRTLELRMFQKTLEICLSETHASRNREVWIKDLSSQAMLIPDATATMEKEWKEVIKNAHKNKRQEKSTLLHWWTSATSKRASTSREMVTRTISSVDVSTYLVMFARVISSAENSSEAADVDGEKHAQPVHHRGTVHKLHRGNRWSRKKGNYGSLLRKKKRASITCVANLHSRPWNITSKADKSRTTLKRRWIFKRASGNRCLHDAGQTRLPRKAAAAAAAAAASENKVEKIEKERILREDKIRTTTPGWQTCRKHSFEILNFKCVHFDTMIDVTEKMREQRIGMFLLQVLRTEECTKFPN